MSDSKLADRRAKDWFIIALWALAAGVGILDLVYVLDTWWMGSDFQYIVLSVTALVHHRPVSKAFVYPPGMLILASPVILVQHGRRAEDLLLVFELLGSRTRFAPCGGSSTSHCSALRLRVSPWLWQSLDR